MKRLILSEAQGSTKVKALPVIHTAISTVNAAKNTTLLMRTMQGYKHASV